MAVPVSGPLTRMTDEVVARAVPLLRAAASALGQQIGAWPA
jgi:DNA-binding IclR family transcriptional regulator